MKSLTTVKTRQQAKTNTFENLDQTTRLTLSFMGGVSAIIGIWAAASIVSALIGAGGFLQLSQNWFSAVTGM
jgi:hypothetical protein